MSHYVIGQQIPCPRCYEMLTLDAFDLQDKTINCLSCYDIVYLDEDDFEDEENE